MEGGWFLVSSEPDAAIVARTECSAVTCSLLDLRSIADLCAAGFPVPSHSRTEKESAFALHRTHAGTAYRLF